MKEIDELRQIFVAEVDDDLRAENEEKIREWEEDLLRNESLQSWIDHDITKQIAREAKDSYKSLCMILATNRELEEKQRYSIWARQDAMKWLLSLPYQDPKSEIDRIHGEIRAALNATN